MDVLHYLLGPDLNAAAFVIFNLIIIESLLSVDNAAVLATMVMDLPEKQRAKALKYGIIGAYVFRGLALVFASFLIKIWWLKPIGGAYLLYLAIAFFISKARSNNEEAEEGITDKNTNWLYRMTLGALGPFWATVALVELMDMAFSIDNVLAAAAFTDNLFIICVGVFIGILAMRFVAQVFVKLMERFPFLEHSAFIVIAVLGLKLLLSLYTHYYEVTNGSKHWLENEHTDIFVSIITVSIFFVPILTSYFFGFPKGKVPEEKTPEV